VIEQFCDGRYRRLITVVVTVMIAVMGTATTVAAHGGGGGDTVSVNYVTRITDAGAPGLVWRVNTGDSSVELTNNTGTDVVVLGYQSEPYLKFSSGRGVQRNMSSPATYLNEDRFGDVEIPFGLSANDEPVWEPVSDTNQFTWLDHRTHWLATTDPAEVRDAPDREHLLSSFSIPLLVGDANGAERTAAQGDLRWLPDVAWWPPIVILGSVFAAIVAVVAAWKPPTSTQWTSLGRVTAFLVLGVASANIMRTVDDFVARATTPGERIVVLVTSAVPLIAIVALCTRAWFGRPSGFGALAVAALMLMLLFGGEASSELSAPQLVSAFPAWIRRWTLAASYTVVVPAFLAATLAATWYARSQKPVQLPSGDRSQAVTGPTHPS
jgi:hypothetical protein